jgi:photosystem II stability/assembly factor-like uncharacterized protein
MSKIVIVILFVFIGSVSSQEWMENLSPEQRGNYYEIQNSFNQYWEGKDISEKGQGYKQFKRWEWFWESRILEDGSFPEPNRYFNELQKLKKNSKKNETKLQGFLEWNFLGPEESGGGYSGLGRVNVVRTEPFSGGAVIWVGAASGGLWKSTDAGVTWSSNTDDLVSLGVQDIVIDPNNTNTMYIATGDRDGSYTGSPRTYSAGVLKTLDGGMNWNETGLKYIASQGVIITRLLMDPNDANILYASTTGGIYKTTDAGENWTQKNSTHQKDMEFHPDNSTIIYASNKTIIKTTDGGDNWATLSTGLPTSDIGRIAIAVTGDEPDRVFAIISRGNGASKGIYRSDDGGDTWTEKSPTSPNMLGSAANGTSSGGQGWYDIAIAVDDLNADNIFVGGVNTWKSTDGGNNWEVSTNWYNNGNQETIHADQHDFWFEPGSSRMYISNDGGVYRTSNNGGDYDWIGSGLKITQFYKVAISWNDEDFLLAGAQDNGTKKLDGGEWVDYSGGDGMEPMIDYSDDNIIYSSYQNGNFSKSTNRGASRDPMVITDGTETGAWITPIALDYDNTDIIYVGKDNMWKSTDGGSSTFTKQAVATNSKIIHIAVSQSNTNIVYFTTSSQFWRSSDGGANWTRMSRPGTGSISYISVDPADANKIFATNSGWSSGNKVFLSEDGGDTWENFSGALPNVPTHCVFYEGGPQEKIYVGNDLGVYYTDNTKSDWEIFSDGLPNVIVTELEMNPTTKRLFASTYGRGVWYFDTDLTVEAPNLLAPADDSKALDISTVIFDWSDSPEAEKYQIQVAKDNLFSDIILDDASLTESTRLMSGLSNYEDHFWRVKGIVGAYSSSWSEVWAFQTEMKTPILIAPEHQSTSVSNEAVLDWEIVEGSSTYLVELSLESDFDPIFSELRTEEDSLKLFNLPSLSDIYWRVRATNEDSQTAWSSEFMFTTKISSPTLTLPANASSGIDTVYNFEWEEVNGIIDYVLEISPNPNFDEILFSISEIQNNSITIPGMSYSEKYYWRVKARAVGTESDWSVAFNFTTKIEVPVLISPDNNSYSQDKDLVLLEWNAPEYSNSFTLEMSELLDFSSTLSKNIIEESQMEFTSGEYGKKYFWRVNLSSDIGQSDWSSIFSFTTELESPTLTNPANKSTNQSLSGNLVWEEIAGAEEYIVQIANDPEFSQNMNQYVVNSNNYNYKDLENNNIYYWRVRAASGENSSAWSEVWYFTSPVDKPLLISPADNFQTELTDIDFSWASISSASYYDFQLAKDDAFSEIVKSNENRVENSVSAQSLNIGEYFWRVRAFASDDYTDWSEVWSFKINKAKDLPAIPLLLSPSDESDGVQLSSTITWQMVDNANGYDVQLTSDDDFDNAQTIILDGKNNTSHSFSDFAYSKIYRWRVRAFNSDGTSDWSGEWTFKTIFDTYIISQNEADIPFTLFPNPSGGEFFIRMKENASEIISVNLTGINGEEYAEIFSGFIAKGNDSKIVLDVGSGNYLLNVSIAEKQYSVKIAVIK